MTHLVLEEVTFVQQQHHRCLFEERICANLIEQVDGFSHAIRGVVLKQHLCCVSSRTLADTTNLIVGGQRRNKQHRSHTLKTMYPLLPLIPLATNVKHGKLYRRALSRSGRL